MENKYVKYPELQDAQWLTDKYVIEGLSSVEIANLIGCSPANVQMHLRRVGIKARGRHSGKWNPKECQRCNKEYIPSGPANKFCSLECRAGTTKCKWCAKEFALRAPKKSKSGKHGHVYETKFCSKEHWRAWQSENGKRMITTGGYVMIKQPATMSKTVKDGNILVNIGSGAPGARKDGRVLEHRWVMEQKLGRQLEPWETVHHLDGNGLNNDLSNLQLRTGNHGKGVVRSCLDCGSSNIGHKEL